MSELKMPEDLTHLPIVFVVRNSPAWGCLLKLCADDLTPGRIIPITEQELESLREDVLAIKVTT